MDLFCIQDYGLTAAELASKYLEYGRHHTFTQEHWQQANSGLGYWEWVEKKVQEDQDELDKDNPYNQYTGGV